LAWDHPDIYPTQEAYNQAFAQFLDQCTQAIIWHEDAEKLGQEQNGKYAILDSQAAPIESDIKLGGWVNRANAWQAVQIVKMVSEVTEARLIDIINKFPGLSRRFEEISPNIYSDYAHTPEKIRGALQMAQEVTSENVVVVYEGLHNLRQHFIRDELAGLFRDVKNLYIVPSYLAREDQSLELLTPEKLLKLMSIGVRTKAAAAQLNGDLKKIIQHHAKQGDLVLCLSGGGAGSLDEWLRKEFAN
jgi:UDP-N-acetylmuramate--alanine ligase